MSTFPVLMHTALDATDGRALAEFDRRFLGLHYRPGDEGSAAADWLVLLDAAGNRVFAIAEVPTLARPTWPSHEVPKQMHRRATPSASWFLPGSGSRSSGTGATVPAVTVFEHADLSGALFRAVNLSGAQFRGAYLAGVRMRGVELCNVDIHGELLNVTINGVDIGPLVEAELNRRHPERATMRPTDPAGFREAWDVVERLWDGTVQRARGLPPELLHESVDDEWSFIETLRHLVFATECWVGRAVLGDPAPWHPLSLPWDEMPDTPGVPRDRAARPSLGTVLALRRDRMAVVRRVIHGLTDESLAADTEPVEGPGWPEARSYPVRECLSVVLNEEWEHRLYAERDLDALTVR